MIRLANEINPSPDRLRYVCNVRDNLGIFPAGEFTFIYSNVVLQHIVPARALLLMEEMLRVLAPGGSLVFQLPSHLRPEAEQQTGSAAMPAPAYRASVRIESAMPARVMPGDALSLVASVTNAGDRPWRQSESGPLKTGQPLALAGARHADTGRRASVPSR